MALEAVKQPVINGYFIAGSLVGPGGAGLIKVLCSLPFISETSPPLPPLFLNMHPASQTPPPRPAPSFRKHGPPPSPSYLKFAPPHTVVQSAAPPPPPTIILL